MPPSKRDSSLAKLTSSTPVKITLGALLLASIVAVSVLGIKKMMHSMKVVSSKPKNKTISEHHQAPPSAPVMTTTDAVPSASADKEQTLGVDAVANAKTVSPPVPVPKPPPAAPPAKRTVTLDQIKTASVQATQLTMDRAKSSLPSFGRKLGLPMDTFRNECKTLSAPIPRGSHLIGMTEAYAEAMKQGRA